ELIRAGASDFIYEHSDIEEVVTRLRSHLVTNKKEANLKVSPPGSNSSLLYNQLFSKTFHSPGVLMAITTLDEGEFIDVNSAFLNLLGYKRDEIIGKTVKELGIHQSYERRDEVIAQLKKGMKITERELTIYNKWGEKRIGYASFEIINIQGESYLLTTWDDITSLKHYEQQLNKLYMAIGQSSSMVIIAEPDGRITFANNQFFRETGYNSEDLSKADVNLFNYVYPDKHNINDIWNRLNSGENWEGEVLNTKKNGETFWERASISPVFDKNGGIIYYIAIKENITEEKELSEKLLKQNEYDQLRSEFWKFAFLSESEKVLLEYLLNRLGKTLNLDRVSFLKYDQGYYQCTEQWARIKENRNLQGVELPEWLIPKIIQRDYYQLDETELNELISGNRMAFKDLKSLLIMTFGDVMKPSGFFLLEDFKERREWSSQEIKIAGDLSNIVKLKTETLESTEILRRSEEKFRIITENSRELVCVHDCEGKFKYVSPSSEEMLGYTPEELLGQKLYNFVHAPDIQYINNQFLGQIEGNSLNNKTEYRVKRKDDTIIWFETITQPIKNTKGEVVEIQSSSRDITERKYAEQQIREKEEKYRNIFESMFDVYMEISVDKGEILEISPSVERISGYTRNELVGISIFTFYAYSEEWHNLVDTLFKKEKVSDFELTLLNREGQKVTCSYSVRMIRDQDGNPKKMVGTLRDISERKRAEIQLEEAKKNAESASKAKSEFLANMSHEIRTPMNAILGFSEVLMNKIEDEESRSHLEAILSSGRTLLSLINDILDLSKIEAGKMQINYEPVELPVLVEDIQHIFEKKLSEKNLDLKIDIDRNLPGVLYLDEVRIRQILFNLVGNAIKFTDEGYIKIGVYVREKKSDRYQLNLIVEDTGVGIPRKQQRLIFNAFHQQEGQDSRRYEGSGLGLSITRKLVEKMDGQIKLDSRIGQGSKFEILLPDIKRGEPREFSRSRETVDHTDVVFLPATILIVDDIQYNIETIKNLIDSENIKFTEAQNAEKALEILKITPPDLILMDLKLPDMSGYEATAIIRSTKKSQAIPVLAFTASAMANDENQAKSLFDDFITKPVTKNELYGKITKYLSYKPGQLKPVEEKSKASNRRELNKDDHKKVTEVLEYELMSEWEEIKDNLVIYKIEAFLDKLGDLNEKYNIEVINNYYHKLAGFMKNLDIENMEHTIREFPRKVEEIRNA
ncbi:MAG: PAS domain S-box protein, partial [Bacteroidota bacterium]